MFDTGVIEDLPFLIVIHEFKYGSLNPVYVSNNVAKVVGVSKERFLELQFEGPSKTLHPDDQNIMTDFAEAIKKYGFYHGFQRINFDGAGWKWIYVKFKILEKDSHGNISKIIGFSFPLDEQIFESHNTELFLNDHLVSKRNKLDEYLSAREKEIAALLFLGYSDKEVGDQLYISEKTAKKHRFNILKKLEINSVMKLTRHFISR